eukprot:5239150-Amphidinium_carterae.1
MQPQVQRLSSVPILPLAQTITESPAVWPPPRASSFNSESMGVEGKINRWLGTIAIGSGAERGWDQAQVAEIALFAQDQLGVSHALSCEIMRVSSYSAVKQLRHRHRQQSWTWMCFNQSDGERIANPPTN